MKRIPLYKFYKRKYGTELLIDVLTLNMSRRGFAVLTCQHFAKTTLIDMEYDCIGEYQKEEVGQCRVIHSTWSFLCPMDKNFGKAKEIV